MEDMSVTLENVLWSIVSRYVPIETFSGEERWDAFSKRFENLAICYSWSAEEKGRRLAASLSGQALFVQAQLPKDQHYCYTSLCQALDQKFGHVYSCQKSRTLLHTAQLQPGEKLADLGTRLQQLVVRGYPQLPKSTQEELLVDAFIRSLPDELDRVIVGMRNVRSLKEALHVAMEVSDHKELRHVRPVYHDVPSTSRNREMTLEEAHDIVKHDDNEAELDVKSPMDHGTEEVTTFQPRLGKVHDNMEHVDNMVQVEMKDLLKGRATEAFAEITRMLSCVSVRDSGNLDCIGGEEISDAVVSGASDSRVCGPTNVGDEGHGSFVLEVIDESQDEKDKGHDSFVLDVIDESQVEKDKGHDSFVLDVIDESQDEKDNGCRKLVPDVDKRKTVELGRGCSETDKKHFTILVAPGRGSLVPDGIEKSVCVFDLEDFAVAPVKRTSWLLMNRVFDPGGLSAH